MSLNQLQDLQTTESVGDWVAADFRLANVFTKYGIDFCCGGDVPVGQACAEKGISVETLLRDVQTAQATAAVGEQYNDWSIDFLSDYIVNQFHAYTRRMLPQIVEYAGAVANAHGAQHPETITIAALLPPLAEEMLDHMDSEEELLYPYIKQLVQQGATGSPLKPPAFGSAEILIEEMDREHEETGDVLEELVELSDGFTVPDDACNTYRALYGFLTEFEATTKKHIHLENNILFPKAIRLEKQLAVA